MQPLVFDATFPFPVLHFSHEEVYCCIPIAVSVCEPRVRSAPASPSSSPPPSRRVRKRHRSAGKGRVGQLPAAPDRDCAHLMFQLGAPRFSPPTLLFSLERVTVALPQARLSCYIRAMKRIVLAAFLVMLFAVPAVAAKHKVTHPKPVHAQNPYLSHANHKAHRQHHKKI